MIEYRRVSHGVGWPANAMFFFQQNSRKEIFILPVVHDNKIMRNMSHGVEGKSGLICLMCHLKLLVPTCFAISCYP